ncbi:MAG: hypothetical protein JWO14_207 [Solirubrobacterales bacterium]|nr:hypothetical protein [Solirubrobacterales bacterium]
MLVLLLLPATPAMAAPAWVAPVDLTAAGVSVRTAPEVAVDSGGDAVAVWKGYVGADEVVEAASRQAGGSWQAPVELSGSGHDASEPQVAVDSDGDAVAVWKRREGADYTVEAASRPAGGNWQAPVDISTIGQNASGPQVAVDPGGDAVAVWELYDGTDHIVQAATSPAGGSWQAPVDLSTIGQNASEPQVAVDPGGDAVAVWKGSDSTNFIVQASTSPAGGSWQAPVDLSAATRNALEPQVAVDPGGDAVAVWERYDGADYIVQAATSAAGGSWQTPVDLSAATQNALEPQVAVDPAGDAVAVWERYDGADYIVQASTSPPGGSWQTPVDLSAAGQDAIEPQVAVDPDGDAVAVWENETDLNAEAASRPSGGSWQAPVAIPGGHDAHVPQVAVDPAGDALAVWEGYEGGHIVQAAAYDATGPQLRSLSIPAAGTVGQSLAFSVSPLDVWSALGPVSWNFGDGAETGGAGVSHTYTAPGNYTVTLSAADAVGNLSIATGQVSITPGAAPAGLALGSAGAGPASGPVAKTRARVGGLVLVKNGKALLKLSCPAGAGCRGVVKLSVAREVDGRDRADAQGAGQEIGQAAFKIAGAKAKTVPVKLSVKGEAQVRAAVETGRLKAHVAGTGVIARTVVLKEARRR